MKKILLSIIALCCTMAAGAQDTDQISAILQNGEETTVFYGIGALQKAMEAAPERGGVITLSSGNFNAATINKDVKIYGASYESNASEGITLTNINGSFYISIPEEIAAPHNIVFEGVNVNGDINVNKTLDGLSLTKVAFNRIYFSVPTTRTVITQSYIRGNIEGGHNLYVQNSYFSGRFIGPLNDESTVLIDHCILTNGYNFDNGNARFNCQNSIVATGYNNGIQTYNYCLCPHWGSLNGFIGSANNWFSIGDANVFEDAEYLDYNADRTFILKDPDNKYIGNDGTQVGVYGGNYPWNKLPSTPVVKNLKAKVEGTNLDVDYDAEVR